MLRPPRSINNLHNPKGRSPLQASKNKTPHHCRIRALAHLASSQAPAFDADPADPALRGSLGINTKQHIRMLGTRPCCRAHISNTYVQLRSETMEYERARAYLSIPNMLSPLRPPIDHQIVAYTSIGGLRLKRCRIAQVWPGGYFKIYGP
ncbi:hypothetical protein L228DRAFT_251022 [Xylona heveae TC161]|uniref:Uncharacterized protein n=1 Tax=Xylona heveae (strain CBS 132557 / TC161) TaxID=1328760 RepID=A0A164ZRI6_XYLHT|nr:hypothetical protein L228DRAFT_251022 [Xylona heveae TC161]KZF19420.1 hypothetical protein L228DRAFT_251022 [Xylona heveae TC161]